MKLPIVERLRLTSVVLTDETIAKHCREEIKEAAEIIEALAKALEPFVGQIGKAGEFGWVAEDESDDFEIDPIVPIGHFRRARAALARAKGEKEA